MPCLGVAERCREEEEAGTVLKEPLIASNMSSM